MIPTFGPPGFRWKDDEIRDQRSEIREWRRRETVILVRSWDHKLLQRCSIALITTVERSDY
jgi:hypothetical protein